MEGKWIFPPTNGGEKQGLNNTGIEQFRDNPIRSLARETCQNSLDAGNKEKVVIEFKTFQIHKQDFPQYKDFESILLDCKEFKKDNATAVEFFDAALKTMNATSIQFLRISDFNTTGLDDINWNRLVEESGDSNKAEEKSGSHGIGKHAPFACSSLRTVFYSTLDNNGYMRSKGVSRLTSRKLGVHEDGSDNISQGTGYYGIQNSYSINCFKSMLDIDKAFNRTTSGTDVYVAGFNGNSIQDKSDILFQIETEIIDGFMMAIWDEKLEIKINNKTINKSTLKERVDEIKNYLNKTTILNLEILFDNNIKWIKLPVSLGSIEMGSLLMAVKLRSDAIKGINKVSMFRSSGMKIFDKDGLCPLIRFSGICVIEGKELNSHLRKLENASHNKWAPERYQKEASKTLLNTIYNVISQHLEKFAETESDYETDIVGAGSYLPDDIRSSEIKRKITGFEINRISEIKVKNKTIVESNAHLETNQEGADILGYKEMTGTAHQKKSDYLARIRKGKKKREFGSRDPESVGFDDEGNAVIIGHTNVKSKQMRIFCLNKNMQRYKLVFYPTVDSEKGYVEINKVSENNEKMPIKILQIFSNEGNLSINKNSIKYFNFIKDEKISLELILDCDEYSTMEVKLYAYQG